MKSTFKEVVGSLVSSLLTEDPQYILPLEKCIEISTEAIRNRNCIFVCGNGGSAATASHIANDLLCHLRNWNRESYRILSLTDNVSTITSLTNDYGPNEIFARQLSAFGNAGDILWAFSTSGNSGNCLNAFEKAKELGILTVGITGRSGGRMKEAADIWMPVNSDEVTRVEELHMIYAHILAENIEAVVSPIQE